MGDRRILKSGFPNASKGRSRTGAADFGSVLKNVDKVRVSLKGRCGSGKTASLSRGDHFPGFSGDRNRERVWSVTRAWS